MPDALGSVRNLVNSVSEVTLIQSYTPFGEVLESYGDGQTDYAFTGEMYDAGTGLVFLRARYYNPTDGRFLNRDVWGGNIQNPQTMNSYNYGLNSPMIYTDPSGEKCIIGFDVDWIPGKKCTDYDRQLAADAINYFAGFVNSPNFAVGYLYEVIDSLMVVGPEITRMFVSFQLDHNPMLNATTSTGAIVASIVCKNDNPIAILSALRNGLSGDFYYNFGRAAGRVSMFLLTATEITVSVGGAALTALASPFTAGISIGGTALAVSMTAYGALVLANVAVKEMSDHLILQAFTGKFEQPTLPGMEEHFLNPGDKAEIFVSKNIGILRNNGQNRRILQEPYFTSKGKRRIPDFDPQLTPGKIVEVKDRGYIAFEDNLRDFYEYAKRNGLKLELWYRGKLSEEILRLSKIENPIIILKNIPDGY
jgi:RHS repeat-associated protein